MNALIFADRFFGGDIGRLALAFVVICAVVAIAVVAVRAMGLQVPGWVWHILTIIAVAVVAILAIKFVLSL